jgi:hypothetical protein
MQSPALVYFFAWFCAPCAASARNMRENLRISAARPACTVAHHVAHILCGAQKPVLLRGKR